MRVLIAIDGSPCASYAVKEMSQRAWGKDVQFRVLNVCEPLYLQYVPIGFYCQPLIDAQIAYQKEMRELVGETVSFIKTEVPSAQVEGEVVNGSVTSTILEEASKWRADLIVLGYNGHAAFEKFVLGSVAQKVAANSPCSVEIVKNKAAGKRHFDKNSDMNRLLRLRDHVQRPLSSQRPQCQFSPANGAAGEGQSAVCACTPDLASKLCHCDTLSNPWLRHRSQYHAKQPPHHASLIAYIRLGPARLTAREQSDVIEQYCAQHDFTVDRTFVENGVPGLVLADAMEALSKCDGLIAVDLDAFVEHPRDRMRDLRPLIHHFFCHHEKHLIAVEEGVDTGCATGQRAAVQFMNQLKGS